jgi:hypothetical protein
LQKKKCISVCKELAPAFNLVGAILQGYVRLFAMSTFPDINEALLQYAWKLRNFDQKDLFSTAGEMLEVLHPGQQNTDAGPDFFNARIRIGQTLWAGNVEVHVRASDWKRHRHPSDSAYEQIILHVVYEADEDIFSKTGTPYPTLELKQRISPELISRYKEFRNHRGWIPCGLQSSQVSKIALESWLERVLIERLSHKAVRIRETLDRNHSDWEETFYIYLARNFGFRVNAVPFELLARSLPLNMLLRYRDNLFQLEALLFGQAGLLNTHFAEQYAQRLQSEYQFLARKHTLIPLDGHLWKFLRLRPLNFPTLRIAQFAKLISGSGKLFARVMEHPDPAGLKELFSVGTSEFWHTHYHFEKGAPKSERLLGKESVENIVLNTVAPFLFVYSKSQGEEEAAEKAMNLLSVLEPENNTIIRSWKACGLEASDAGRSQALLELKEGYCNKKKCLDCGIGRFLLKNL